MTFLAVETRELPLVKLQNFARSLTKGRSFSPHLNYQFSMTPCFVLISTFQCHVKMDSLETKEPVFTASIDAVT